MYDLWKTSNTGDVTTEAKKFYIKSLQDHLVLLDQQMKDASKKTIDLGDSIEAKEKEKDRNEERKALMKSKKRKLKQLIPSFENSNERSVNRVTRETLCVKNNTIELLDSGKEDSDFSNSSDDDEIIERITKQSKTNEKK